jgi:DNA-binding HxlR family transcriptional regulator
MALGPRSLRTEQLARRLDHVSERSVYRYAAKLVGRDLVERFEKEGVPSTVILSLTDPPGRHLYRLLGTFAGTHLAELPSPDNAIKSWGSLKPFGQFWESGFVERLSREPRTLTQLAGGPHGLTYHQVTRRIRSFTEVGLVLGGPSRGHGKCYELTEHSRRRVALIVALGRWRHRFVLTGGQSGLTGTEMATVIRAALPLILLPNFAGLSINLGVAGPTDKYGQRAVEALQGVVGMDGAVRTDLTARSTVDGSVVGTMNTWLAALLDGNRGRMRSGGELSLVDACLIQLHGVLWETAEPVLPHI